MSLAPVVPANLRIAQCNLTDQELAYIADLIKQSAALDDMVPGWTFDRAAKLDEGFLGAAQVRGIKNGVKTVCSVIELRA